MLARGVAEFDNLRDCRGVRARPRRHRSRRPARRVDVAALSARTFRAPRLGPPGPGASWSPRPSERWLCLCGDRPPRGSERAARRVGTGQRRGTAAPARRNRLDGGSRRQDVGTEVPGQGRRALPRCSTTRWRVCPCPSNRIYVQCQLVRNEASGRRSGVDPQAADRRRRRARQPSTSDPWLAAWWRSLRSCASDHPKRRPPRGGARHRRGHRAPHGGPQRERRCFCSHLAS